MDANLFQQSFQEFDRPALLKTGEGWLENPAAQALCLGQADLAQLEAAEGDALLWLARQFYHVSASQTDGGLLVLLQPDSFLSSASENLAGQLRDRLTVAFGAASSLSGRPGLRDDLRAREALGALNRELYRVFRMVTQLEQCISPNPLAERVGSVDMAQWFQHLADELGELCKKAGVKFTAESDVRELTMAANRRELSYMVLSLASNALKNRPQEGGRLALSMKTQQGQVILTVADNAGGFSADYLSAPLWNSPQRLLPRRGLGLGLPLIQRVAAAHQGAMMVFPEKKGTRVVISLPIRQDETLFSQPEPSMEDAPGFSLAKILLSDALPSGLYFPGCDGEDE